VPCRHIYPKAFREAGADFDGISVYLFEVSVFVPFSKPKHNIGKKVTSEIAKPFQISPPSQVQPAHYQALKPGPPLSHTTRREPGLKWGGLVVKVQFRPFMGTFVTNLGFVNIVGVSVYRFGGKIS
jgi:hypothetical protein